MNKRFRETLPSELVKYVVVILLSVAIWIWAFGLYHAPKATEKIALLFAGEVRDFAFEKDSADAFEEVKLVEVSYADPSLGVAFEQKYSVVALSVSDVVLVPESIAMQTECKRAFAELPDIEDPFVQEGITYGSYLSDAAKERLSKYFKFREERYVAFASAASVNAGKKTDHSIRFIEWLVR